MPVPSLARALRAALIAVLATAGSLSAASLTSPPASQAQAPVVDLTADGVAAAAARYVAQYQREFALLLGEEVYLQQLYEDDLPTQMRRIEGDIFIQYLAADDEWITVHDVKRVDGRPVADREDLVHLGDVRGAVERLANRNAAFNIGTIIRNFNEPVLALQILTEKRLKNSRFRRVRMQNEGDVTLVTLSFEEKERPTLIRSATGGAVYAKGSFVIEAGSGRVRESTLEVEDGRVNAKLVTTYVSDDRLNIWVPASFDERYERDHRGGKREIVTGQSTYTNYRRFEVTGRIK